MLKRIPRALLAWRIWVGVLVPASGSFAIVHFLDGHPVAFVLVAAWCWLVVPPFARLMVRAQSRAELQEMRDTSARLHRGYAEIRKQLETLPPEASEPELRELAARERVLAQLDAMLSQREETDRRR